MGQKPFSDLKVADFSWGLVGPLTTKYLADFGATIVKVESGKRPEGLRLAGPYAADKPGLNRSGYFGFFNSNKYSLAVDLDDNEGRDIAKKLISWRPSLIRLKKFSSLRSS